MKTMHIASCSFGKDSICQILLAMENNEPLDRIVFAEVMFDHERGISGEIPEHIEWIYSTAIPKLEQMGDAEKGAFIASQENKGRKVIIEGYNDNDDTE